MTEIHSTAKKQYNTSQHTEKGTKVKQKDQHHSRPHLD